MKKIYNKLVRDKIPAIIEAEGKKANYRVVNGGDFIDALEKKLIEELIEFAEAETLADKIAELADISDVSIHLSALYGLLVDNGKIVTETMEKKRAERGGFTDGVFLESVEVEE